MSYLQHHLESLTEEDFERHRQALSVKRSEKPKKLKDESGKYWGEIISQQYHFVRGKHIGPLGSELCWHALVSFPGRSRLQFLITCSIAKMEGEGLGERVTCMTSGRHEGGGGRSLLLTNFALISLKSTKN